MWGHIVSSRVAPDQWRVGFGSHFNAVAPRIPYFESNGMKHISRREAVQGALGGSFAFASNAQPADKSSHGTARDHFWIFTVNAGMNDDYLAQGGVMGGSRMTPAEGAFFLGVPNLILVRENNSPLPPARQKWRAKTSFEQFAISFLPLKRVVWSVVGSGGAIHGDEMSPVLDLAKNYPNITGVYLDDFFRSDGPSKSLDQLKKDRQRLQVDGRRLESWLTLYTQDFDPNHAGNRTKGLPLQSYLDLFDVITMWTWNSNDLHGLEQNLERLEKATPNSKRALGCYLWDFFNRKPVPLDLMEKQCNAGLNWMKAGRIQEMIFLANTVLDVGLEVATWTREWIADNGNTAV